jgi:hypothetical protein
VRDGVARLESARENLLPGGSFEEHHGDVAAGFDFQDGPGKGSFIDTDVRHGGRSSIRFENPGATMAPHGNARVMREVTVSPWREYHASVWLKTEGWGAASDVRLFAMGEDGRVLSYSSLGVRPTQDWTEHHVVFNSLSNSKVRIYCGTWGGRGGKLWMDDLELEETAFVNLVRREGCPLAVRGEAGTVCTEGRDYEELHDPRMGCVPWPGAYEVWHEPPTLRIPRGSRIREGAKLRVDFFHAVTIHDGQVACCLGAPGVFRVLEDQVRRVVDLFHPKTLFLEHDEIRVANWCDACRVKNRTAGGLLAENMRKTVAVIRKIAPGARLAVWSDMFDPFHNAHDAYYLVNGDLSGAWEGLPEDMIVVNWNRRKAKESLPFFGKRGHEQVLAGYYDGDPADIAAWWKDAADAPGVDGVMYTTWRNDFSALETFARAAWGGRR